MKNLKTLILAGVCAAALSMPAMADEAATETTSGPFASLSGGYADLDANGAGADLYFVDLSVGAGLWDTNWNLQGQLGWEALDFSFGLEFDNFTPGLSVFTRDSSHHAFGGGFVWHGVSSNFFGDFDFTNYGVFGEFYLDKFTLGGGIFAMDGESFEGWGGQIDGTYYVCDSALLRAFYRHHDVDNASDTSGAIGLSAEYKIEGSALSFGLNYEHIDAFGTDADMIGGQLKFRFGDGGGDVLMTRDRNGAIDTRLETSIRHVF